MEEEEDMFADPNGGSYSSEEFVDEAALAGGIDPEAMEPSGEPDEEPAQVAEPGGMVEMLDDSVQGFFDNKEAVFCVAISPVDKNVVACGGAEDKGFLFNAADGERLAELGGHDDSVSSVAWNHDGTLCATGGLDGRVQVWDAKGARVQTLEGPSGGINFLRWHPRGNALLAGSEDCSSWLWLAEQNKTVAVFFGHAGPVECGDMTADGKICVTGSEDCTVRVWRPKDGVCLHTLQGHAFHRAPVVKLAVGRGTAIVSGDADGGLFLSNIEGHVKVRELNVCVYFALTLLGTTGWSY
jgi:WD40 repeat protein